MAGSRSAYSRTMFSLPAIETHNAHNLPSKRTLSSPCDRSNTWRLTFPEASEPRVNLHTAYTPSTIWR